MQIDEQKRIATLLHLFSEDIEAFGSYFFPHKLTLPTPQFHRDIYELYQDDTLTEVAIAAPRGHAKSSITDEVFLAWAIINKKFNFGLLISDTFSQAVLFLDGLKSEFEGNDRLRFFYGDLTSEKWSESQIVVNGIMIMAIGAGQKVRGLKYRGNRPDLIVIDDLENDELVQSQERRDKLERWFNGALLPARSKSGRIIMIGTILHYSSLLAKIVLDPNNYSSFKTKLYKAEMDGKALWEEHMNLEELAKKKAEYMEKGQGFLFYNEYMNDPVSGDVQKFKQEKFKYYEDKDIEGKLLNTFITIDRAYSKANTADSTGIVVVSVDLENNWYVRQAERFKGTEKELIAKMFDLHTYYSEQIMGVEQKAFEYTIKPALDDEMRRRNTFFVVTELKDAGRSKNLRIEGLVPRFESATIYIKKDQVNLMDELVTFPMGNHDDLCLAGNTKIQTIKGQKDIKDIKIGDLVQTRKGLRRVLWSGQTGVKKVITNIGITGTPNHPVITNTGIKRLEDIKDSDIIFIWNLKQSYIEVKNITDIQPLSTPAYEDIMPVYNLHIEGENEFFANNILVHNCDALAYMLEIAQVPNKQVAIRKKSYKPMTKYGG